MLNVKCFCVVLRIINIIYMILVTKPPILTAPNRLIYVYYECYDDEFTSCTHCSTHSSQLNYLEFAKEQMKFIDCYVCQWYSDLG